MVNVSITQHKASHKNVHAFQIIIMLYDLDVPFGSIESGNRNNENCPQPRPFPPNAEKVTDNAAYECLPSYLRNPNAVLDDDDGTTVWAGGQKPDYSVVDEMFNRGKKPLQAYCIYFTYRFTNYFHRTNNNTSERFNGR